MSSEGTLLRTQTRLATLAQRAAHIFSVENPTTYQEIVQRVNGRSIDVLLIGIGWLRVAMVDCCVCIYPLPTRDQGVLTYVALTPDTLIALIEERLTLMDAFFRGDLIVQVGSAVLHVAYEYCRQIADTARQSRRLQWVIFRFRNTLCRHTRRTDSGRE
ncbi:MAG: hypothetical protein GYB65_00035 [Chloroflexi bacterium]|nr:hypothetical protein [Chloroflexota bacterium]